MKYFTPELWLGLQRSDDGGALRKWEEAAHEYNQQLANLKNRLRDEEFAFFEAANVHDGELLDLRIIDGSRPAELDQPVREWQPRFNFPVLVELSVLDATDKFVWHLAYSALRSIVIRYPNQGLFYQPGEGFGDWGYDELTDANEGFLRHEVLFSTGSIIAFEFREITVRKILARSR